MSTDREPGGVYTRRRALRRGALAVAGVAGLGSLAGCSQDAGPLRNSERRVFLDGTGDLPSDAGVGIDIEQLGRRITQDGTVGYRVTTTNREREKRISVASGPRCCLFNRERGGSQPGSLWLHHVDDQPTESDDQRWSADRPADEPRTFEEYECSPRPFTAGESVTNEYRLWADYRLAGYIPAGAYRFRTEVVVDAEGEGSRSYDWEFSVTVDRARSDG
jgi:hypothetical protein